MRVLHVVTLASSDGAFGGPLSVARANAAELRRRGHSADVVAGRRPSDRPGAGLFPVVRVGPGFSGLASPRMLAWLWRHAREHDVAHVHLGRDLVTILAAVVLRLRGVPYVTQTHGMVLPDRRPKSRVLDALATRRVLRAAARRYVLNAGEEGALARVVPGAPLTALPNGVPLADATWTEPVRPEVLFCARLHPRKRPRAFAEMAGVLRGRGVDADFVVAGPDEGELASVTEAVGVTYEGALAYDEVIPRLCRTTVFVLPSVDEPFPMTVLEAMSAGVPAVVTTSCGIADVLRETGGAVVSDPAVGALADAVEGLLRDRESRTALSLRAREVVRERFSVEAVGERLEADYLAVATTRA